jgi:hypothetical protein
MKKPYYITRGAYFQYTDLLLRSLIAPEAASILTAGGSVFSALFDSGVDLGVGEGGWSCSVECYVNVAMK